MTVKIECAHRPALPVIAVAALLLAGCSSGHVGEDWQCPLAAGGSCASVAAADPAVPKAGAARTVAPGQPIRLLPLEWDMEETAAAPIRESEEQRSTPTRSCEAECGFDSFAWLARLFGGTDDGRRGAANAGAVTVDSDTDVASSPTAAPDGDAETPAAASRSASSDSADGHPAYNDDLRTGEVVARIWIAPFVDADGVYREASHVRVVLEPAGWRLP